MENLQSLLSQIAAIVQLDKQHQEERRYRGEFFNVFNILGLSANETRTHSAFIAQLLDPKGNHGLGDKFLRAFIQSIECLQEFGIDIATAEVRVEEHIGLKNEDCTEGGRIDIVIKSNGKAIIIENKVYAVDQEKQLVRYANYGDKTFSSGFRLLYLTLFGGEASDQSCCNLGAKDGYYPVGYNHEILIWLERCIQLSASHPLVRETITQYKNLIKELTHMNMETQYSEKIIETMSKSENIDAVAAILNLEYQWEGHIIEKYIKEPLAAFARSKGLEFVFDEGMFGKRKNTGFFFYKPAWKSAAIYFYTECNSWRNFYRGVSNYAGGSLSVQPLKLHCLAKSPTDSWPYGWEHLTQYKDWDRNTMLDMVKGHVVEYLEKSVDEMLNEIENRKLAMP